MTRPVLLLGFTLPDADACALFEVDALPAVQTHKFAWSFARALRHAHGELRLLSASPVQNYPIVPRLVFRAADFQSEGVQGRSLGFINLVVLKHITRFLSCIASLPRIARWRVCDVYIHGAHTPFLLFGLILRVAGRRVVPVLTDPPGIVLPTDGRLSRVLKRIDRYLVEALVTRCSAVVALAPALTRIYNGNLPTLVAPGILNREWIEQIEAARGRAAGNGQPIPPERRRRRVLYAGGLSAAYGVDLLLDVAALMPDVDFVFLGKGDQLEAIFATPHRNVRYDGFVGLRDLAAAMIDADILINPRPSQRGFAVQSFPSKLIEYLASGRPVLTTRIASIPDEIAECFHYIDDESAAGIAEAIRRLLAFPVLADARARNAARLVGRLYSEAAMGRRLTALRASGR